MSQTTRRPSQENFGQRLTRLRKLRGFTQRSLASKSGVSNRMIAYYETHELRLWRQLREVEKLPDADRKAVLRFVDALLVKQRSQQKTA